MIFFHRTTQENADSILSTQDSEDGLDIKLSLYDIKSYLEFLFDKNFLNLPKNFLDQGMDLEKEYILVDDNDGETKVVEAMYLGKGFYCFTETNLAQARDYRVKDLDALLKIKIDSENSMPDIFDLTLESNLKKIRRFLNEELMKLYADEEDETKEYYKKLKEILQACLKERFKGAPHCAGIILELFLKHEFIMNLQEEPEIVKCSFVFGKKWHVVEYAAIRDTSIIKNVELVE